MRHSRWWVVLELAALCAVFCAGSALAGPGDGTIIGVTKIVDNGPNALRWNLVVVAEGFTSSQQASFDTYAKILADNLMASTELQAYTPAINVWRLDVASNQAGADDPLECGGSGTYVNTYFDASFCNGGIRRLLIADANLCINVLNTWMPEWDVAIILVNSTVYGGAGGGPVATSSLSRGWSATVIHELGHSAFGLGDEYESLLGCGLDANANNHPNYEPSSPNITIQSNRSLVKWRSLIQPSTPVPTTINADCSVCDPQGNPYPPATVGLYEGADYYHCGAYRPQFNCRMRDSQYGFCAVCLTAVDATLSPYLPTHVTLQLASVNPSSGVAITVSPPDTNGQASGTTPFSRTYSRYTDVTLTAPTIAGGNSFAKWLRDGIDYPGGPTIVVSAERNRTITASYLSCADTFQQAFIDQNDPICINRTYCVFWRTLPGASSYEVSEDGGPWVSTAADTTKCYTHALEGTYSYQVRAVSNCGPGVAGLPVTMTVQNLGALAAPDLPTLVPAGPVCLGAQYTVRWNPVPGATSYEIRENNGAWRSTGAATQFSISHTARGSYVTEVRAVNICGESGPSLPVTMAVAPCYDLIVYSSNPAGGVPIAMSPPDQNLQAGAGTPFVRVYCTGTPITLDAPTTFAGHGFFKWLRDGADYSFNPSVTITFDTARTMTAVYFVPTVTVEATGAPRVVMIGVTPADLDGLTGDYAPFTRTYEPGTAVTLTAPASANNNPFVTWRRNGIDYPGGPSVVVTMDSSYTMTAVYRLVGRVEIESKAAVTFSGFVPVRVKLTNDVPLRSLTLPLEIRSVSGGAFINRFKVSYAERLLTYLTGVNSIGQYANANGTCKTWQTNGYHTKTSTVLPDVEMSVTASPEGILITRGRLTDPVLPAGADALGSIILSLLVSGSGSFEIDTTCMDPSSHFVFTQEDPPNYTASLPVFTKGTITVSPGFCACPHQGDLDGNGVVNVFDVIKVIGVAFSGDTDPQDTNCPGTRGDVNSNGITDVFDVIYIVVYVFTDGPGPMNPCVP